MNDIILKCLDTSNQRNFLTGWWCDSDKCDDYYYIHGSTSDRITSYVTARLHHLQPESNSSSQPGGPGKRRR